MTTTALKFAAVTAAAVLAASQASAETIVGLTGANTLITFDSATPGTIKQTRVITGIGSDVLLGIDRRAANNSLYAIGRSGQLYRLNLGNTGATAVPVGAPGTPFTGTRFGIDFNPTVDRLRVVTDGDGNFRINPNDGTRLIDGMIAAPGAEALVGSAYTNNFIGATATTLYGLDAGGNQLLRSTNANAGTYVEVGTLMLGNRPLDLGGLNNVGFDISGSTGAAFFGQLNQLYSINLGNAQVTSLGTVGGSLVGLAVSSVPEPSTWAMMIGGFGMIGGTMRVRSRKARFAAA